MKYIKLSKCVYIYMSEIGMSIWDEEIIEWSYITQTNTVIKQTNQNDYVSSFYDKENKPLLKFVIKRV